MAVKYGFNNDYVTRLQFWLLGEGFLKALPQQLVMLHHKWAGLLHFLTFCKVEQAAS